MRHVPTLGRLLVGALLASALAVSAGPAPPTPAAAEANCPDGEPDCGQPQDDPDAPAKAHFGWRLRDRYAASWDAWSTSAETYRDDYVNPDFLVDLDACASGGTVGIASYRWTVTGPGDPEAPRPTQTGGCHFVLALPEEASYTVELSVTDDDGQQHETTDTVTVDDLLVVSLGDSAASGEGNPEPGGGWKDRTCHRSTTSGPALAAAELEADPHRSVTFVSLACSGAEIDHGILGPYNGREPDGTPLRPQLELLEDLLCPVPVSSCDSEDVRKVDALTISIGVNDVGFSDVILQCIEPNTQHFGMCGGTDAAIEMNQRFADLEHEYDDLVTAIEDGPLGGTDVFVTEYPNDIFEGGDVCGVFSLVSGDEAAYIRDRGAALNRLIDRKTNRPRWRTVDGIAEAFHSHGYCESDHWYIQFDGFSDDEGAFIGTLHPNRPGHEAIAERLVDAISSGTDDRAPVDRAVVTFERVKVLDGNAELETHPNPVGLVVGSAEHSGGPEGGSASFDPEGGFPLGEWVSLPSEGYTFRVDLSEGDELLVSANTKPVRGSPLQVKQGFEAGDGRWGRGEHTAKVTSQGAELQVTYSVALVPKCRTGCDDPTRRYEDETGSSAADGPSRPASRAL